MAVDTHSSGQHKKKISGLVPDKPFSLRLQNGKKAKEFNEYRTKMLSSSEKKMNAV